MSRPSLRELAHSRAHSRSRPSRRVTAGASTSTATQMRDAKMRARETTREYAKSFFLASQLMSSERREHAYALYAWCRELDQIVDGATVSSAGADVQAKREALDRASERLRVMFDERRTPADATYADLALYDATQSVRGFSRAPFDDMVRGMRRDLAPNENAFPTFDDVETYAYEVAGTVALMILPILTSGIIGDEESSVSTARRERGVALGIALQLTNIVRDVGEDARARGRVYISTEDLALFNLTREDVMSMEMPTPSYKALVEYQIQRALGYYGQARDGVALLPVSSRPVAACIGGLYKRILLSVRENGYDNLNKRAFASKFQKLAALPSIVIGSMIGASDDDGSLKFDFTNRSEVEKLYRATMCRLFVAVGEANDVEISRCVEVLRALQTERQAGGSGGVRSTSRSIWYASKCDFGAYEDSTITVVGGVIRRST